MFLEVIPILILFSVHCLFSCILAHNSASNENIPEVSLLLDFPSSATTLTIKELLSEIEAKHSRFNFGVAFDAGTASDEVMSFADNRMNDTFNYGVAENKCKWHTTEPSRGEFNLAECLSSRQFFTSRDSKFRFHNLVWHEQLAPWVLDHFTADEVLNDIIPTHVKGVLGGLNAEFVSIDALNEVVTDTATESMSALECVTDKHVWPTSTSDTDSAPLIQSLAFIEAALKTARSVSSDKLLINDYSIGGANAKTSCIFKILSHLQSAGVPVLGLQSHVGAKHGFFDSKSELRATLKRLDSLNLVAAITEMDVWVQDSSQLSERWQAAIFGDYLDVCLYSSNCHEFTVWGLSDAESWLNHKSNVGIARPLLFDAEGREKLGYQEVKARLVRYLSGKGEVCETAAGVEKCRIEDEGEVGGGGGSGTFK